MRLAWRSIAVWFGFGLSPVIPPVVSHAGPTTPAEPAAMPTPDHLPIVGADARGPLPSSGRKVLFINFDGQKMRSCGNSNAPAENCSTIFDGTVLPYSGDLTARAAVVQTVRASVAPFGIAVTDARPTSGDYDMVMVGNWDPEPDDNFAGVAPGIDCWDSQGGQVSFGLEYTTSSEGLAEVILQEVAHTWGLSHVSDVRDLLFPTTQGIGKSFRDECFNIVDDVNLTPGSSSCTHHQDACDSAEQQNSYAELLMIFGPGEADSIPPSLEIVEPPDRKVYKTPEGETLDLDIVLDLDDNNRPTLFIVRMWLEGDTLDDVAERRFSIGGPAEYLQPIAGLSHGEYTLTVEIEDEAGLVDMATADFSIVPGNPDEEDVGCGCRSDAPPGPLAGWWLLLLPAARLRRCSRPYVA